MMPAQILVADDDLILRDIVEAALTRRGFSVTLADDGFAAVEMIGTAAFDIVLLDYHMPSLDGFGAARQIESIANHAERPRLIGISGDPDGLETRDQARPIFDAIVQKPINIPMLLEVIEASLERKRDAARGGKVRQAWSVSGLDRRPRARFASRPSMEIRLEIEDAFDLSRPENPDCVLLADPDDAGRMGMLRTHGNLFTLPVIDLIGAFGGRADAAFRLYDPLSWQDAATCIRDFAGRRLLLTPHFLRSTDIGDQLLAYVFVSGRNLRPLPAGRTDGLAYPGFFPAESLQAAAATLVERGLLSALRASTASKARAGVLTADGFEFALTDEAIGALTGTPPLTFS